MPHKFLLTFGGSQSWTHNIKCRKTHVAHTVHTTTTCFMSRNHVVPRRMTKFLSVWTHLKVPINDIARLLDDTHRTMDRVKALVKVRVSKEKMSNDSYLTGTDTNETVLKSHQ